MLMSWLMLFVSLGVVGVNLNYAIYMNTYSQFITVGTYVNSQASIVAFDVLLLLALPALLYATYLSARLHCIFVSIVYSCIILGRWISGIVFLSNSSAATAIATSIYNSLVIPKLCKVSQCSAANCAEMSSFNAAYAEEIAAAVLFFLFGFPLGAYAIFVNKEKVAVLA
jgi:hypothetical protein